MRRTCARPPATAFHPSVCHRGGANTSHQESEGVGAMRATFSSTRRALLDGWSPYALLRPSPCLLFKPPKVPSCPGKSTWTDSPIQTSLCASGTRGQHPVPSPDQQCTKAVSISPTLSPSRDKNTGSSETYSPWLGVTSAPGAFPCSYNANLSG